MARVLTIGHSTRAAADFVALLGSHAVETLVDIRRFPGSRRHPQFGREALERALRAAGITYLHEPGLGGRRAPQPDSPNTHWRNAGFRGYADHMRTTEFLDALHRLVEVARQGVTAIMCAEAVPWRCHRQLVADALVAAGHEVAHVIGPGPAEPHVLNPAAIIAPGGLVTYPAGGAQGSPFGGGQREA